MRSNHIQAVMAAMVLATAAIFLVFAMLQADVRPIEGYTISARFNDAGGIDSGADVRINGIRVGTVRSVTVDPQRADAVVTMTIRSGLKLPDDSVAGITTLGLTGPKFVQLAPGKSRRDLAAGAVLAHTRDHTSVEESIGQAIFQGGTPAPPSQ